MDHLAVLFGRHRLLLACGVMTFTAICLFGISRVTFDNDVLRLLRSDKVEFKWLDGDFAHLERTTLIVVEGEDLLTREGVEAIRRVAWGAAEVEGVEAVYSMLSVRGDRRVRQYLLPFFPSSKAPPERFEQVRRRAGSHPLLIGHFLSEDVKTSLVIVQFDARLSGISQFKRVLRQLQTMLAECTEAQQSKRLLRVTDPSNCSRCEHKASHNGAAWEAHVTLNCVKNGGLVKRRPFAKMVLSPLEHRLSVNA